MQPASLIFLYFRIYCLRNTKNGKCADSHVNCFIDGPGEFIQTNIVGTHTLPEAAKKYYHMPDDVGKATFKIHQISTDYMFSC